MGDMLELGRRQELFHRQVGRKIAKVCDIFITVGKLSKFTAQAARICGFNSKNIFTCESAQEALDILFKEISPDPNDIILIKGSRAMMMEKVLFA
jgi:UDP-N-acetylmuramoyl-tripeptide--D-alanyl-D-alanine ligase